MPPLFVAPLVVGLVRWMRLVRRPGRGASFAAVLGLSVGEVLLWTLSATSAAYVYFAEKGFIPAALILGLTVFVAWRIDRRLHPAGSRIGALRMLFPPLTLIVLVGLTILARR
jgi:cytochrome c oxidase subunit IV